MANRKYDYSEDVQQPAESASEMAKTSETEEITAVSAEEMRRQRLEQRNDTLANEFRKLKPEIVDAHRQLNHLIEGIGAYAGTMQNLQSLLESSFPIKFAESDKLALKEVLHAIANDAITKIQNEHEKANRDIHRNDNRISMTQTTFWCMIALLLILATFFALVIFANVKMLHSEVLSEIIIVYAGFIIITSSTVSFVFYKRKH